MADTRPIIVRASVTNEDFPGLALFDTEEGRMQALGHFNFCVGHARLCAERQAAFNAKMADTWLSHDSSVATRILAPLGLHGRYSERASYLRNVADGFVRIADILQYGRSRAAHERGLGLFFHLTQCHTENMLNDRLEPCMPWDWRTSPPWRIDN